MKNLKRKNLVLALLVVLALAVAGTTYAYWQSTIAPDSDTQVVTIGAGGTSSVTLSLNNSDQVADLIPSTQGATANDTAILTFDVLWSEDLLEAASGQGTLAVTIDSFYIENPTGTIVVDQTATDVMFDVTISTGQGSAITMDDATPVTITITVFFANEPANQAEYDLVANGDLVVNLSVSVNPTA